MRTPMTRFGAGLAALLLCLGSLTAVTRAASPSPQIQTLDDLAVSLSGMVTGLGWSAGCTSDTQIVEAYRAYWAARTSVTDWLKQSATPADCRILGQFAEHNVVLTVGKTAIRDCLNANGSSVCTGTVAVWKYHGIGTNNTAANASDTGCGTETTTAYNPDNTRATGSQTTNGATVYRTIGTNTVDGAVAAVEWCLFSNASVGSGTALSHVVFSTINLSSGDSLQTTYDFTLSQQEQLRRQLAMLSQRGLVAPNRARALLAALAPAA